MTKKNLTERQKRCQDCACLVLKSGVWCCDECFGQKCEEIDDCPEGVTLETVEEALAVETKVETGARAERKERKPREKKVDDEKVFIISEIAKQLTRVINSTNECENITITNESKIIEFDFGGNHYKLDLIKQRKPKN